MNAYSVRAIILTRVGCTHGIGVVAKGIEVNERSLTFEEGLVNTKMKAAIGGEAMGPYTKQR
jgi:hypothetical protein